VNKAELVEKLYQGNSLTKSKCRHVIDRVVESIAEAVTKGDKVTLRNFGVFEPAPRQSTKRFHPVTGESIDIPAKVIPKFSPGKGFNEAVKENLKVAKDESGELEVTQK